MMTVFVFRVHNAGNDRDSRVVCGQTGSGARSHPAEGDAGLRRIRPPSYGSSGRSVGGGQGRYGAGRAKRLPVAYGFAASAPATISSVVPWMALASSGMCSRGSSKWRAAFRLSRSRGRCLRSWRRGAGRLSMSRTSAAYCSLRRSARAARSGRATWLRSPPAGRRSPSAYRRLGKARIPGASSSGPCGGARVRRCASNAGAGVPGSAGRSRGRL